MSFDGEYTKVEFRNFGVRDSLSGISTNIKHHYKKKTIIYKSYIIIMPYYVCDKVVSDLRQVGGFLQVLRLK
jgi:hypothetical protein